MTDHYGIITFNSTHHAIASEKRLIDAGYGVRIIPVPTQVTADCGLAIRFDLKDFQRIRPLLNAIDDTRWYEVSVAGRKKEVTAL